MSTLGLLRARAEPLAVEKREWRPLTLAALATLYLVWGSTYLAMRVAVTSFPPLLLGGLRFFTAGILLFLILAARGAKLPTLREWGASAVVGFFMMVVGLGTVSLAFRGGHVTSGVAALVFGTVPLWTAVFERAFGRTLGSRQRLGLALGFAGVLLVATRGTLRASPGWGAALAMCAASYAFGCALTFLLRTESAALATSYAFVNPVVALGLGAAIGGEHATPSDWAGVGLVILAVAVVASARRTR